METKELLNHIQSSFLYSTLPRTGVTAIKLVIKMGIKDPRALGMEIGKDAARKTIGMTSYWVVEYAVLNADKKSIDFKKRIYARIIASYSSTYLSQALFRDKFTISHTIIWPTIDCLMDVIYLFLERPKEASRFVRAYFPQQAEYIERFIEEEGLQFFVEKIQSMSNY